MWTRGELKQRAKQNLMKYHWAAVGACLILLILQMLAGQGNSNSASSSSDDPDNYFYDNGIYNEQMEDIGAAYGASTDESLDFDSLIGSEDVTNYIEKYAISESGLGMFSGIMTTQILFLGILLTIVRVILNFFIVNPVIVGHAGFFYKNRYEKTSVGELAFAFNREDLFPVVKTMFLRDLYIVLWTFLLIIPGIIKNYAYRMVPFILSEYPQMPAKEALRLSNEMTRGHKMKMFILDLSFFGWMLLGVITLGISDIVFTTPYIYATEAELYHVLKMPFIRQSSADDVF
ncbi:MAG: DUF975 family protein [Lachnospiraceae bacterium]|nr:DUF975 family protein [Lachnospiraceae bacterium]